jgi:hypothetical protein
MQGVHSYLVASGTRGFAECTGLRWDAEPLLTSQLAAFHPL